MYCLDTSGLSTPLQHMPADIHPTLWKKIEVVLSSGIIAVTTEIHEELCLLDSGVGMHIKRCKPALVLELMDESWDWQKYVNYSKLMQDTHKDFISEYNGNRKRTIGLNDLSTIALARTLRVPVVSSEAFLVEDANSKTRRIPNVCKAESVEHLSFSEFLRREQISI